MKVIKPVEFGVANLISSNVPENDYPAWVAGTDYAVAARVVYDHAIYESAQTPNVGQVPDAQPLYWTYISETNRWKMFDTEVNTQTVIASPLQVTVAPGLVNSMALMELQGTALSVIGRDGLAGPIIYEHEQSLEGSTVSDWYEYFFEPFSPLSEVTLSGLPVYGSIHLSIEISSVNADVACGAAVFGTIYEIGKTLAGPTAGITDYSRKETSTTGTTRFQQRRFSRRMSQRLWVDNQNVTKVYRLLSDLRATPCVWIGADSSKLGFFTIFGFYRDFNVDVAYYANSYCSIEIEGLT